MSDLPPRSDWRKISAEAKAAGPWTTEAAQRAESLRNATRYRELTADEQFELRVLRLRETIEAERIRRDLAEFERRNQ